MNKKIAINLFNQDLMTLQEESNKKEKILLESMKNNLCNKCGDQCIFMKYKKMISYSDPTLVEWLPKQGDIWSKEYQCQEILKIMEEE